MSTFDHEIEIDSVSKRLNLAQDENGKKYYTVAESIPEYRNPLRYIQNNWIGGHGQHDFRIPDKYFEGKAIDTTQEGKAFPGPEITEVKESDDTDLDSAPVVFCWFPLVSKWLCATAGKIYLYGTKWTAATTIVAGVTDLKVYNGVCYAAKGTSNLYYTSTNGDTWTITDLTDGYSERFLAAPNPAGTSNVLWKFKTPNELSNTTNGVAGGTQWSSPAYIGDTANNIIDIFLINDNLMIGRTDGLWNYDSNGGLHQLMGDLRFSRSTDNFKYGTEWQTGRYFSLLRGMGEITSYNTYDNMGPLTKIDDIGKVGDIVGIASDKDFLYVAVDEGTNTIIYKGREVRRREGLRWEFCPWIFLGTKTCATMAVCQHSSTDRRLWFGYTNTTAYVKITDNPLADTNARFTTNSFLRMPYDLGTDLYWDKMYQSVITQTYNCTANNYITINARKDTDTTANAVTAAIVTNGTVKTNLTAAINCNRIQYELDFTNTSNTSPPVIEYFEARGIEQPETIRTHEAIYIMGDEPTRRTKTTRDFLRGGRDSNALIKFADLRYGDSVSGTYVWTVMEPGYPQEIEIIKEKGKQPEIGIKVRLREVSFTV
uniref:Uncharacterized protein n=1 Tax=viral metagenome TaxID=1070528 RepID=A0A6M3K5E2_9ZZZZ